MKAIIQSYTPQECERIINGRLTIKVCKTAPKDTPFKVYMYRRKEKSGNKTINEALDGVYGGGKVIGEYVCEKVDKYRFSNYEAEYDVTHDEMSQMWLNHPNLIKYGKGKTLRGLHVSSLKIYDKPKELKEFGKYVKKQNIIDKGCEVIIENWTEFVPMRRPPHGWQYVEDLQ